MEQQTATLNALKPVLDDLAPQHLPDELEKDFEGFYAIRKDAEKVLYLTRGADTEAFMDHGSHIHILTCDPAEQQQSIQAAIEIAKARGWRELEVTGTDDFRRQVWMEASLAGIQVKGYVPSPEDKAELEKLRPGSSPAELDPSKISAIEPAQNPEESVTATEQDHKLVQQATEKREANGGYQPSLEELRAIDRVLIQKAKPEPIWKVEDKEGMVTITRPDGQVAGYGGLPAILNDQDLPDDIKLQAAKLENQIQQQKSDPDPMVAINGEPLQSITAADAAKEERKALDMEAMSGAEKLFTQLGSAKERLDASKDRPEPNRGNDLAADTSRHTHNSPGR